MRMLNVKLMHDLEPFRNHTAWKVSRYYRTIGICASLLKDTVSPVLSLTLIQNGIYFISIYFFSISFQQKFISIVNPYFRFAYLFHSFITISTFSYSVLFSNRHARISTIRLWFDCKFIPILGTFIYGVISRSVWSLVTSFFDRVSQSQLIRIGF